MSDKTDNKEAPGDVPPTDPGLSRTFSQSFNNLRTLNDYFPASLLAVFAVCSQVIYEPYSQTCVKNQRYALGMIFFSLVAVLLVLSFTHTHTGKAPYYRIRVMCTKDNCNFSNWGHTIVALFAFTAQSVCSRSAAQCLGLNTDHTQYVPFAVTLSTAFIWGVLCPKDKGWQGNEEGVIQEYTPRGRKSSSKDSEEEHLEESDSAGKQMPPPPTAEPSVSQWSMYFAAFPSYHAAFFDAVQQPLLSDCNPTERLGMWLVFGSFCVSVYVMSIQWRGTMKYGVNIFSRGHRAKIFKLSIQLEALAVLANFVCASMFQHDTMECLIQTSIGVFSNVMPVFVPMIIIFLYSRFATPKEFENYQKQFSHIEEEREKITSIAETAMVQLGDSKTDLSTKVEVKIEDKDIDIEK